MKWADLRLRLRAILRNSDKTTAVSSAPPKGRRNFFSDWWRVAAAFALLKKSQAEAEMEEEINTHLEFQRRKHVGAGVSPEQAFNLARRDFGSIESAKDRCRDQRRLNWFAALSQDLRYAARMFRRDPVFYLLALVMLAVAIGANVASFSVMDALLLRMLPVKDPGSLFRTVRAAASDDDATGVGSSYKVFQIMRQREGALAELMAYQPADQQAVLFENASERTVAHQTISGNYFKVLGVKAALGRLITLKDDQQSSQNPVAVISDRLWREHFAKSANVIGAKARVGGRIFQIVGVVPSAFFGIEIGKIVDIWTPISMAPGEYLQNDHFFWLQVMGRLHAGVTVAQAAAPMQAVMNEAVLEDVRQHAPPGTPKAVVDRFLQGMKIRGAPAGGGIAYLRQQYRRSLEAVMCLVAIVLLIACTNVANLLLAKGTARSHEIAVRLSLGAGRQRVLQQLITESALLGLFSTILGVLAARWITPVLVHMLAPSTSLAELNVGIDLKLAGFAATIAIITVLLSGMVPAFHLVGAHTFESLKSSRRLTGSNGRIKRQILVSAQIALSLILLVGATLFGRTLANLLSSPLGFQPSTVVIARLTLPRLDDEKQLFPIAWNKLLQQVQMLPGLQSVSLTSSPLFNGNLPAIGLRTNARASAPVDPTATILFVSAEYLKTLSIPLISGREFKDRDSDPNSSPNAIVNQAFVRKFFGSENPLGRKLTKMADAPDWTEIVGVVHDTKTANLRDAAPPILYLPYGKMGSWILPQGHPGFAMALQVRGHQDSSSLAAKLTRAADAQFKVLNVIEQQQLVNDTLIRERLLARIAALFGVLSLVLAAFGLYGVVSYAVVQRQQEIGIRMALGAAPARIVAFFLRESTIVIFGGVIAGLGLSVIVTKAARALLYSLTPNDPPSFLAAALVLVVVTFIAAIVPAYKASAADPMTTLRDN